MIIPIDTNIRVNLDNVMWFSYTQRTIHFTSTRNKTLNPEQIKTFTTYLIDVLRAQPQLVATRGMMVNMQHVEVMTIYAEDIGQEKIILDFCTKETLVLRGDDFEDFVAVLEKRKSSANNKRRIIYPNGGAS